VGTENIKKDRSAGPSLAIPHTASSGLFNPVHGGKIIVQLVADSAHCDLFASANHRLIRDIGIAARLQSAQVVQKTAVLNLPAALVN